MIQSNNSKPKFFLLAGSVSHATTSTSVARAHEFVRELTRSVVGVGDGFVVFLSSEPVNEAGQSLVFDWTILREMDVLCPARSSSPRIIIVTTDRARREKMNSEQRQLIAEMSARNLVDLVTIPDDVVTGGNIGDEQAERAAGMIALGGGKGVTDRARKLMKKGRPVFPMDLVLGANSEDGEGALGLYRNFMTAPLSYLTHTGAEARNSALALSLEEPSQSVSAIAAGVIAVLEREIAAERGSAPTDVLLLTALAVELKAARVAFSIGDDIPPARTQNGHVNWRTQIPTGSGKLATCTIATIGDAGNVGAAAVTASLIAEFKPKLVVMIGIAAGMRDKVALGDVVISERVVAYEGAALLADGVRQGRPETYRPTFALQQNVAYYLSTTEAATVRLGNARRTHQLTFPAISAAGKVSTDLMPKQATVASGEKLLRDPNVFMQLREQHGKTEVAEMEAVGIFAACRQADVDALVIRGISDFGDSTKDNAFHDLAAKAAAIVAADMIAYGVGL